MPQRIFMNTNLSNSSNSSRNIQLQQQYQPQQQKLQLPMVTQQKMGVFNNSMISRIFHTKPGCSSCGGH